MVMRLGRTVWSVDNNRFTSNQNGQITRVPADVWAPNRTYGRRKFNVGSSFKIGFTVDASSSFYPAFITPFIVKFTSAGFWQAYIRSSINEWDEEISATGLTNGYCVAQIIGSFQRIYSTYAAAANTTNHHVRIVTDLLDTLDTLLPKIPIFEDALIHWPKAKKKAEMDEFERLTRSLRYWNYLHIALIRDDLWMRYNCSLRRFWDEYKTEGLAWQLCWPDALRDYIQELKADQPHLLT
jgi:hypothetical protein